MTLQNIHIALLNFLAMGSRQIKKYTVMDGFVV